MPIEQQRAFERAKQAVDETLRRCGVRSIEYFRAMQDFQVVVHAIAVRNA